MLTVHRLTLAAFILDALQIGQVPPEECSRFGVHVRMMSPHLRTVDPATDLVRLG